MMKLNLLGNAKRRSTIQLIVAIFSFAFSAIILGIGVAIYNDINGEIGKSAYSAGLVFAIFEFGSCIAMLALWVSLYINLRPVEVLRRVMSMGLAIFTIILAYIACVVIVDALNLTGWLITDIGKTAWEAINGLVVAFTGIGLITAIITNVMVHKAANRLNRAEEAFVSEPIEKIAKK